MKNNIFFLSIFIIFGFLFVFNTTNAFGLTRPTGGRIIQAKASEIQTVETAGFVCPPTQTILINPVVGSYPKSYIVTPATGTPVSANKWILGLYMQTVTPITCTHPEGATTVVNLNTLTRYGTSR